MLENEMQIQLRRLKFMAMFLVLITDVDKLKEEAENEVQ